MAYKKWIIADADKEKASVLSEKFNIDPFISFLMVARGIDNDLAFSDFLSSSFEFSDPFCLADMDKAVNRIEAAVADNEKITVYGDYDCDGVTSTALLVSLLKEMGADVDFYIPSREKEGYGLNISAIDKIKENNTDLIITVDNGIASVDEANYISSLGMDLVITDHHQLGETLPNAVAVVNPYRPENNIRFRDICGVGVAFKLACALYGDTDDMLYTYGDLVAIGTIADMVPLLSENRGFVKTGLKLINSGNRPGIAALKKIAGGDKIFTSTDTAFLICPRINATGRIDSASVAVELLLCDNEEDANRLAAKLNDDNVRRQELEQEIYNDVKKQIENNKSLVENRVIVISGAEYHHGIVGIVASRILDEYSKPVIIIGEGEDGFARGSARSVDGFNIFEAISYCKDLLIQFGGHPRAAGMGLVNSAVNNFREKINEYANNNYDVMPCQAINIDCKLSPFYLDIGLVDSLNIMEPFGENNPKAVFALTGLNLLAVVPLSNGKHVRLECEKKGKKIKIVKFGTSADNFPFKAHDKIDVAVRISKNLYNGKEYLSVQAVDVRLSGIDEKKYFNEKTVYEKFLINKNNDSSVVPNKTDCAYIYKFLKANNGWHGDFDSLYFRLKDITYGKLKFAFAIFEECGFIKYDGKKITLLNVASKVDLTQTNTMKSLKGRLNLG